MTFRDDAAIAIDALDEFARRAGAREGPVISQRPLSELLETLAIEELIADGGLEGQRLRHFLDSYLAASTRLHHPRYMAHQVAVPQPLSAVGALVDGFMNNAMAIYEMGPAAAAVEHAVINWMLAKAGWRPSPPFGRQRVGRGFQVPEARATASPDAEVPHGGGVLTHGGSLANLTALIAARGRVAPDAWEKGSPAGLVVVATQSAHYSVARAAGIMGLGARAVRHAPTDALGRMDPGGLHRLLTAIEAEGRRPLAVVASACSTALGLYDPVRAIAEVCRERAVWLHVDGAHGAAALVSPRLRHLLDGLELADSLIWDAHKMLRTSNVCAAVLVKDHRDLDHAFREEASYLFHDKDQPGFDFIHRTVECTKAALGLRVLFALASEGEGAIAAGIERQTDLAKSAAGLIRATPGFEVAVEPETNIVCFRADGPDELQIALRRRLTEDGSFYISTTEALGRRWLRLALMNPATELSDVSELIGHIGRHLSEMQKDSERGTDARAF